MGYFFLLFQLFSIPNKIFRGTVCPACEEGIGIQRGLAMWPPDTLPLGEPVLRLQLTIPECIRGEIFSMYMMLHLCDTLKIYDSTTSIFYLDFMWYFDKYHGKKKKKKKHLKPPSLPRNARTGLSKRGIGQLPISIFLWQQIIPPPGVPARFLSQSLGGRLL